MSFLSAFSKLCLHEAIKSRSLHTCSSLLVKTTSILYAEPLKKKKRLDPAIVKQREERRKKKIEKQIRRLEKNARQLKPIDELEVPLDILDQKKMRQRSNISITEEIAEKRALLHKEWARYKLKQKINDFQLIDSVMSSQQKALEELRKESEELYQEAIQPDIKLVPFAAQGPVATPPIEGYDSPDGEYIDVTKKWDK